MTDDEVIDEAAIDGFELEERVCQDAGFGDGVAAMTGGGPATTRNGRRSTGCATG
jgi:hypothetical protein